MADVINVELNGTDRKLGLRFDELDSSSVKNLVVAVEEITGELETAIRADAPFKSGKLKGSIIKTVFVKDKRILGRVFVSEDFAKAGLLEYGGKGRPFDVKGHQARLDHFWFNRLNSPIIVMIAAYNRSLTTQARQFLRGPAKALAGPAVERMRAAIDQSIAETDK